MNLYHHFTAFAVAFSASLGQAEEEKTPPAPEPTAARILGKIPDGAPPPPAPPKPQFIISQKDIIKTSTHEQAGRTITMREINPIALPLPPAPAESATGDVESEFSQRLADYRANHPRTTLLFLGATVYRSKDSPPRTLVRYWPEGNRACITFWSSADFAFIAGGIHSFADGAGKTHSIFMSWGIVDIDRTTHLQAEQGRQYAVPDIPNLPEGEATYQIVGLQPTAEELVAIDALHNLYNSENAQLKTAFEGRERARIEHEAFLKANPPQPKDIILNYWRTEKPATNGKGESK